MSGLVGPRALLRAWGRGESLVLSRTDNESEVAQSCLTLCGCMDCSLAGLSVHGIFQARVLGCHFLL